MANSASIVARGALGIRLEASFGSGGGIDNWQVIESSNLQQSNRHVFQDRIRGTPEQVGGRFTNNAVAGPITFPVSPSNPTQWWQAGIGGTGPYTPQIPLASIAIEIQEGDISTMYSSGDMIGRLELSSRQGDVLRCNVQIEGKDMDPRASSSTSFVSGDDPYLHSEGVFTLDSVVYSNVTAFSVTKDNNLITDLYANQVTRRNILATKAVVTGSISFLFEDTVMRNRFLNHMPSAITALYSRGSKSFKIDLVSLVYDSRDVNMSGQTQYIAETFTFTAYVDDPSSQNSLKVTVV